MSTIAIMQPYIFPYIGYFQLVNVVNTFVFYDDVNFIKRGWINRNRILVNGEDFMFTVPLSNPSQFNTIKNTNINKDLYKNWRLKTIQTINLNYKKAPYFQRVEELIKQILNMECNSISELAIESIKSVSNYLNIDTNFLLSSEQFNNKELKKQERLINICKLEGANQYINTLGGQELYSKRDFSINGIKLDFLQTLPIEYKQFNNKFVPWLSIIDVMMFNSVEEIKEMLDIYKLI